MTKTLKTLGEHPNRYARSIYSSAAAAQVACALSWLTADGNNFAPHVLEDIAGQSDEEILEEMIETEWSFPAGTDRIDAIDAITVARDLLLAL